MITFFYAALLAIFFLILTVNVVRGRRSFKIAIGTEDNETMLRRVRAHQNFIEYTPLFLLLLFFLELIRFNFVFLHIIAITYMIGRLSHAFGILFAEPKSKNYKFRIFGMMCTIATIGFISILFLLGYSGLI